MRPSLIKLAGGATGIALCYGLIWYLIWVIFIGGSLGVLSWGVYEELFDQVSVAEGGPADGRVRSTRLRRMITGGARAVTGFAVSTLENPANAIRQISREVNSAPSFMRKTFTFSEWARLINRRKARARIQGQEPPRDAQIPGSEAIGNKVFQKKEDAKSLKQEPGTTQELQKKDKNAKAFFVGAACLLGGGAALWYLFKYITAGAQQTTSQLPTSSGHSDHPD
jgi:hypothetical protein